MNYRKYWTFRPAASKWNEPPVKRNCASLVTFDTVL